MIDRYSRPEMARIWSESNRFRCLMLAEWAYMAALAPLKKIPAREVALFKAFADRIDIEEVRAAEKVSQHEVIAILETASRHLKDDAPRLIRFLHYGATSNDLLDTALAMQMVESIKLIETGWRRMMRGIAGLARTHKKTWMAGRSHGVHAEPITFGFKVAGWHAEASRSLARLKRARESVAFGKFSGAMGAFTQSEPAVERKALAKLGLKPEPVATQVVPRDRHAELLGTFAIAAAAIERWSVEVRHLQRTEVLEVEEPFGKGQKGSSAMPHKRNPVLTENLTGLARMVRSCHAAALENVVLWHERDISHSSVERIQLPDAAILLDFMIARATRVIEGLDVKKANMKRNLDASNGLAFSQNVLLALVDGGLSRFDAYAVVQRNAMECWKTGASFEKLLRKDPEVRKALGPKKLARCFDLKPYDRRMPELLRRGGVR